jgi:pyruvate,water dikinase
MNKLVWKITLPLLAGIGATICAIVVFKYSGIQNIGLLILAATIAGGVGNQLFTLLGNSLMRLNAWLIRPSEGEVVFAFNRLPMEEPYASRAGGKGKSLAKMKQEGVFPVPDGSVILSTAFVNGDLTPDAWQQVQKELTRLRNGVETAFAVRSSALQEDSAQASFAGEFESVLNVTTDSEIRDAIRRVAGSANSERVDSYSQVHGLLTAEHAVAVVIQKMVQPDYAGVLFTVDPLTGNFSLMSGNVVKGIGEQLVSGSVSAETFTFDRPAGTYRGPSALDTAAKALFRAAAAIETLMGCPQDIEWAVKDGKVFILQARPITTLNGFDPVNAVWNDSLKGEFLWSATNLMEASPEVLTPFTASLLPHLAYRGGPSLNVKGYPINGIIGGRFYVNISVQVSAFARMFKGDTRRTYKELAGWWGDVPDGMTIPVIPLTGDEWFKGIMPEMIKSITQFGKYQKSAPKFLAENRAICASLREEIRQVPDRASLACLWNTKIFPRYRDSLLYIVANSTDVQVKVDRELRQLVDGDTAGALLSNLGGGDSQLESLGPMAGLGLVASGRMTREEYMENYGHRGVNEGEIAWPRPMEDPLWLDKKLAEWQKSPADVEAMLAKQREAYDTAWKEFCSIVPNKAKYMQKRLAQAAQAARMRERVRSEATRGISVLRAFTLRAGEMLGINDNIFYLTIDELLQALSDGAFTLPDLAKRKETYERYHALPPYPALIRGRFDPFAWAADPNRRSDVFDASAQTSAREETGADNAIHGFAGALGVVEGTVCRLESLDESSQFQAGEVLVTTMTNIGWTPLFPRAAAIVTDLGAPLSHAAIVAREIGIPAVVGCGNATMRLKTGDRVRVDGGRGLVEILF